MGFLQRRAFKVGRRSALFTWRWIGLPRPFETGLTFEHLQRYDPSGLHVVGALLLTDRRVAWRAGPNGQTGFDLEHGEYSIERFAGELAAFVLTSDADGACAIFQPAHRVLAVGLEVEYLASLIAKATGSPWELHDTFVDVGGQSLVADPSPRCVGVLMDVL
ncbi:hypothetical protein [Mumia quercus]|uniref:hypothetical protein n=1 Tax=Mumia quercus TaxID=2976125 RepID=UPI0021D09742|nr:hypothetical protein [Mumia quercus]